MMTSFLWMCLFLAGANGTIEAATFEDELRIITSKHADPHELFGQVRNLVGTSTVRVTIDQRTGRLILFGPPEEIADWERFVAALDVRVEDQLSRRETVILPVRHRRASSIAEALQTQVSDHGRMVVDGQRNLIVVRDDAEHVQAAKRLLESLDVAPSSCMLDLQTLAPGGRAVAEQKIRHELERMHLADYGISMTAGVRTIEGEQFEVKGSHNAGTLSVQGELRMLGDSSGQAEITLQVMVNEGDRLAGIGTTLRVPLDEYIIIGLAPRGVSDADTPLILLLKATRN